MLVRSPDEISLLDIIEAIEGPMGEVAPVDGQDGAETRLHSVLQDITETSRRQLKAIKFSQLLQPPTSEEGPDAALGEDPAGDEPSADTTT